MPAEEVLQMLSTSHGGLSEDEAERRLVAYGRNTFHKSDKKSALSIFLKQLASPLIFILVGAAIVTAVLGEWAEVIIISLAVAVNAGLGFSREYHAENTLEKLGTFIKDRSRVIRGGREEEIDSEMVVPGDVLRLSYGSRVPADARVLHVNNMSVDEAVLTGESVPVEKSDAVSSFSAVVADRKGMVHAGTLVTDGFATVAVVATGDATEIGKIAGMVSGTHRAKTPIQKGLSKLAWIIFGIVIVIVVGIFVLGLVRGESFFDMLVLSVAVSVGAVPEALPIVLTVILAIGAERIAKKRGIARTLMAAETLGSTTLIMTDKTGTLTEANMKLVGVYSAAALLERDEPEQSAASTRELLELALTNIDVLVENPEDEISAWTFKGKPFEVNIAKAAKEAGLDVSKFQTGGMSAIHIPFSSTHKFSVSNMRDAAVVMGAPDILLSRAKISKNDFEKIELWIAKASEGGMRLIALGTMASVPGEIAEVTDIEFAGILAFRDPIRKEVPQAIQKIESLGVRIIMMTGDLKGTAMSVAREIGWNVSEEHVLSGADLHTMTDEALLAAIPSMKIFARVTPEDKLRIGLLYRQLGEVVAMTGDGVNDAPSLKAMDIGVALGSGSDVAKSAADLVLLDDNFQTISASIQEGRKILANIRKAFVYLMSNSLDEVFVIGGSLLVGIALPISALQIIWVNLFTGSLPALAFAYDEDLDHEMSKRRSLKSIFTPQVNVLTFGIGIASSLLLFLLFFFLIRAGVELSLARSIFFVCFASYILAIAFSFRSLHKPIYSYSIFSNKRLNQSVLLAVVILIATMTIPALREFFDLAPLPLVWLWFVAGWLILNILLVEIAKYFFRFKRTL